MSNLSVSKAIRTCKVNVDDAPRLQSARFQDSSMLTCPVWNRMDSAGRMVCPDSFAASTHGCHLPSTRIEIENAHRPSYMNLVSLDARYVDGNDCDLGVGDVGQSSDAVMTCQTLQNTYNIAGSVGFAPRSVVSGRCKPSDGSRAAALADQMVSTTQQAPGMARAATDNRICW